MDHFYDNLNVKFCQFFFLLKKVYLRNLWFKCLVGYGPILTCPYLVSCSAIHGKNVFSFHFFSLELTHSGTWKEHILAIYHPSAMCQFMYVSYIKKKSS